MKPVIQKSYHEDGSVTKDIIPPKPLGEACSIVEIDVDLSQPDVTIRNALRTCLAYQGDPKDIRISRLQESLSFKVRLESPGGVSYDVPINLLNEDWREQLDQAVRDIELVGSC